jgi:hypothetical protein
MSGIEIALRASRKVNTRAHAIKELCDAIEALDKRVQRLDAACEEGGHGGTQEGTAA